MIFSGHFRIWVEIATIAQFAALFYINVHHADSEKSAFSQPADLSASTYGTRFWSIVETRAYPIKAMKISLSVFLSINQLVRIPVVKLYWRT